MGKRATTEKRLRRRFEEMKKKKIPTGPADFARDVGIDRSYLYTFTELAAEISAYGRKTQPEKSKRGPGINVGKAKKKALDAQKMREHAEWSRLVPGLMSELDEKELERATAVEEARSARVQRDAVRRAYERLMLVAVEAGVSPAEIEKIHSSL
jgi:hypothetical protein